MRDDRPARSPRADRPRAARPRCTRTTGRGSRSAARPRSVMRAAARSACASAGCVRWNAVSKHATCGSAGASATQRTHRRQIVRLVQRRERHQPLERGQRSRRRHAPAWTKRRSAVDDTMADGDEHVVAGGRIAQEAPAGIATPRRGRALRVGPGVRRQSSRQARPARRTAPASSAPRPGRAARAPSDASLAANSENLRLDEPALRTAIASPIVRVRAPRARRRSALRPRAGRHPLAARPRRGAAACARAGTGSSERISSTSAICRSSRLELRADAVEQLVRVTPLGGAVRRSLGNARFARSGSNSTTIVSSCSSRRRSSSDRCAISPSGASSSRVPCIYDSLRRPLPALPISIAMRTKPSIGAALVDRVQHLRTAAKRARIELAPAADRLALVGHVQRQHVAVDLEERRLATRHRAGRDTGRAPRSCTRSEAPRA